MLASSSIPFSLFPITLLPTIPRHILRSTFIFGPWPPPMPGSVLRLSPAFMLAGLLVPRPVFRFGIPPITRFVLTWLLISRTIFRFGIPPITRFVLTWLLISRTIFRFGIPPITRFVLTWLLISRTIFRFGIPPITRFVLTWLIISRTIFRFGIPPITRSIFLTLRSLITRPVIRFLFAPIIRLMPCSASHSQIHLRTRVSSHTRNHR
uniref:Uncharacterized protein n=1 Tax=Salix viminalis TaxID=40686 RepID=A0A6N2LM10_SALVM